MCCKDAVRRDSVVNNGMIFLYSDYEMREECGKQTLCYGWEVVS